MKDIATQIRSRLDAIAAERSRLDEEERRLKKALYALEPTTPVETSEPRGLDEAIQRQIVPMTPGLPTTPWPSMPYPAPHHPPPSWDRWVIPEGPQIGGGQTGRIGEIEGVTVTALPWQPFRDLGRIGAVTASDFNHYGHNQD